jgi:outer membrane protein assembly factor BamB
MKRLASVLVLPILFPAMAPAEDWPMWGRDQTRNMVSPEKNAPTDWQVEVKDDKGKIVKLARNIKWSARLGSRNVSAPVIASGLIWVGTNNYVQVRDDNKKDASLLMCFRESDGKFLWQYVSPRLPQYGQDPPTAGMGSSPVVIADRLWLITNRWETICFDIGPLRRGEGAPKELWKVDMRKEFGVWPSSPLMASGFTPSLPAPFRDLIYAVTGNGIDLETDEKTQNKLPKTEAPSLVCLNAKTGKVVWKDNSPGKDIMYCQLSSPLVIEVKGKTQVVMGQGDGWLRSFDAETGKLIWKCDANPKDSKYELGGRGTKSYFMATPVWNGGRIYIATGQEPSACLGRGLLLCIDPTKEGDISIELEEKPGKGKPNPNSGVVWRYGGPTTKEDKAKLNRDYYYGRTLSNCIVHDSLVYAAEYEGYLHCLDARTGKAHWVQDLKESPWGSPLWVDGKIYLPTEEGDVFIYAHGKEMKEPKKIEMEDAIHSSPVFANGVLYIATESRLYAIQEKK